MAGTIVKIKQSSVAGRLPTHNTAASTDIVQGELALNTADQKLYSKDSSGTVFEIGATGASSANEILTYEFTATASQTSFPLTYSVSNDHISVFFNGVFLPPTDYTATSGTAIVLDTGAAVGTEIVLQHVVALNLANGSDIDEHEFTATAAQTSFTISGGYSGSSDVEVYVNGVKLRASDFTSSSGTVIVLGTAASVNDEVTVRIIKIAVLTSTVSQTSETGSAILPSGTTAQQDTSPLAGYLRWNTTESRAEVYSGSTWQDVGQLTSAEIQSLVAIDEDDMSSDSAVKLPTQQSVKAYVDAQIAGENTLAEDDDVNITSAADGSMLLYDTGTSKWIDNVMSGDATLADTGVITLTNNSVTYVAGTGLTGGGIAALGGLATINAVGGDGITANAHDLQVDSTVIRTTGAQSLASKTLTSPVINTGVSGTAILDSDTMTGVSATTLSSSESIKAYVDAQILLVPDAVAMSIALG